MPVIQINLWICEVCGKLRTTVEETSIYSDPTVVPPGGEKWWFVGPDEKLACPDCLEKEKHGLLHW